MVEKTGTDKTGRKQDGRFPKGQSGNAAGRPKGARGHSNLLVEAMMQDEAGAVVRSVIDAAKDGDMTAARLVLERIAPTRKGRPVSFALPPIATAADILTALGAVLGAVAVGDLTPDEGNAVAALLEVKRRAIETIDFEQRLAALEDKPQ